MADQASVTRNNGSNSIASPLTVVSNIADFGNDIATLAELQAKLTLLDAKDAVAKATVPVALVVGAGAVALASLPVILIGLADLLASSTRISAGGARLIVGVASLALAGLTILIGWKGSIGSLASFRRSTEELTRNVSWVRTVLVHSGRGPGRRQV
jgi:hypothetical protein